MTRLVLVGGGRMGEALVGGLLSSGWASPDGLAVVEVAAERREALASRFPGVLVTSGIEGAGPVGGAVVAVKPADVPDACTALRLAAPGRVLSIAAGVPTARLEAALGSGPAVVRAMPNTAALVGAGAAAIAAGASAGEDDLAWAESILGAVGTVVRVPERLLDAVTGLSGSGPAYVFLVAEALIEAGVLAGLSRPTSAALATQTILGAARMLTESGDAPEVLRGGVTSPGGTTAAGLRELERAGVRSAFLDAVMAATERSRQLGG
ncbi:MAG: pyrroline-5-carboxylate reductase [Actinobacteria bacterium]|nr:pyrroline-5-carboxylate reductase [Actinomycetota bacterium]